MRTPRCSTVRPVGPRVDASRCSRHEASGSPAGPEARASPTVARGWRHHIFGGDCHAEGSPPHCHIAPRRVQQVRGRAAARGASREIRHVRNSNIHAADRAPCPPVRARSDSQVWNQPWWLVHVIFASGCFLRSDGVIRAFWPPVPSPLPAVKIDDGGAVGRDGSRGLPARSQPVRRGSTDRSGRLAGGPWFASDRPEGSGCRAHRRASSSGHRRVIAEVSGHLEVAAGHARRGSAARHGASHHRWVPASASSAVGIAANSGDGRLARSYQSQRSTLSGSRTSGSPRVHSAANATSM